MISGKFPDLSFWFMDISLLEIHMDVSVILMRAIKRKQIIYGCSFDSDGTVISFLRTSGFFSMGYFFQVSGGSKYHTILSNVILMDGYDIFFMRVQVIQMLHAFCIKRRDIFTDMVKSFHICFVPGLCSVNEGGHSW